MVSMLMGPSQGAQAGDDGGGAHHLVLNADRLGARAGALAADVEDVGALPDQLQPVGDGGLDGVVPSAVGEAVRRDVDDAHDAGAKDSHQSLPPIRLPSAIR
jgi:hypothetical protein